MHREAGLQRLQPPTSAAHPVRKSRAIDIDPLPKTILFTISNSTGANHAPSGTDLNIAIIEDGYLQFVTSFFGFSDAGDLPPNNFLAVIKPCSRSSVPSRWGSLINPFQPTVVRGFSK